MPIPLLAIVGPDGFRDPLHQLLVHIFPFAHPAAFDASVAARFRGCVVDSPARLPAAPLHLPVGVWCEDVDEARSVAADPVVKAVLAAANGGAS